MLCFESAGFEELIPTANRLMSRLDTIEKLRAASPAILPSMLLCDFSNLQLEIKKLEQAGFSILHLDVMDGVFVPNITYGMTIVSAIRACTEMVIDVHLMIVEPEKYLQHFKDSGADVITIHAEATNTLSDTLKRIRDLNVVSGVALNPKTPVSDIEKSVGFADLVLPMSVEPGFGGQSFDESVLPKFSQLRQIAGEELLLEIDGGVNGTTIHDIHESGVDLMVTGSAIFKTDDYGVTRNNLRSKMKGINERV